MSPAPIAASNPFGVFQGIIPFIVLAAVARVALEVLEAKAKRRGRNERGSSNNDLLERIRHLEKLIPSGKPEAITSSGGSTGELIDFKLSAKRYFFSQAENKFYQALEPVAGRMGYVVFSKVGLKDIFVDAQGASRAQSNYYDRLHVDYLLVSKSDYQPVLGIELNGPSHENNEQQYRDSKKKAVFKAARIPLLQFYNHSFSEAEIRQKLEDSLGVESE